MRTKPYKIAGVIILALGCAGASNGDEYKPLTGQYHIGSKTVLYPPPGEKRDRAYLFIYGEGANSIYDAMPGKAIKDHCGEEGVQGKNAGDFLCRKLPDGDTYCSVAIKLEDGGTAPGSAC